MFYIHELSSTADVLYSWTEFYCWYFIFMNWVLLLIFYNHELSSTADVLYSWAQFYCWCSIFMNWVLLLMFYTHDLSSTANVLYSWTKFYWWCSIFISSVLLLMFYTHELSSTATVLLLHSPEASSLLPKLKFPFFCFMLKKFLIFHFLGQRVQYIRSSVQYTVFKFISFSK